jgi:hypothetical protein
MGCSCVLYIERNHYLFPGIIYNIIIILLMFFIFFYLDIGVSALMKRDFIYSLIAIINNFEIFFMNLREVIKNDRFGEIACILFQWEKIKWRGTS